MSTAPISQIRVTIIGDKHSVDRKNTDPGTETQIQAKESQSGRDTSLAMDAAAGSVESKGPINKDMVQITLSPAMKAEPRRIDRSQKTAGTNHGRRLQRAVNILAADGWWPTSGTNECQKAARILHSFTHLTNQTSSATKNDTPNISIDLKHHEAGPTEIPRKVLHGCAGLAVFNILRPGAFHESLAAGSGVVIARRADDTWSPPSCFVVSTVGAGFMLDRDVYDCVCVLHTQEQVDTFSHARLLLDDDASIVAGPVGTEASIEAALRGPQRELVWSYMKSRGRWVGVQINGTAIVNRADANASFHQQPDITPRQILHDEDMPWPEGGKPLLEVLKALEGHHDVDHTVVQEVGRMLTPGDAPTGHKRGFEPESIGMKKLSLRKKQRIMEWNATIARYQGEPLDHSSP